MIIDSSLIQESIIKSNRHKLDLKKLKNDIEEEDRRSYASPTQQEQMLKNLMTKTVDETSAHKALERILNGNDLTSINYLAKGLDAGISVCRVHLKDRFGQTVGFGTGFLVGPGVMMTNHHVIHGIEDARYALAEFNYDLDVRGNEKDKVVFELVTEPEPIAIRSLDFCLVRVSPYSIDGKIDLNEFGWLPLNPDPGKTIEGQYLTIIQHPGGERKQVCVRENKLLRYDPGGDTLWYATDTVGGSSGSPVFNDAWQVVALHHSGVPKTDEDGNWKTIDDNIWNNSMDESRIKWIANEGIRISQILAFLETNFRDHELAKIVLATPVPPIVSDEKLIDKNQDREYKTEYSNGEMRVTVPVQIAVRVGDNIAHAAQRTDIDKSKPTNIPEPKSILGMEKVDVDQSNYDERTGYDPEFLGTDKLKVSLPSIKDKDLKSEVLSFDNAGKKESEFKYWNYSVMMHKSRKLAIFSAANIDMNQKPEGAGREGDKWYIDPRAGTENQIDAKFYGKQKTFEAFRDKNPFDRGHITRRVDVQWGEDEELAKRNGDDSFHWTNCAPQYWRFNQGSKRWLGLEDFVIKTYSKETGRACVVNGPIFDSPISKVDSNGATVLNLGGRPHNDPTFGDVAIPKMFFKIVSVKERNNLKTAAFLLSQEEYLEKVDRLKGMPVRTDEILTPAEARLYQVKIDDLERLTGLDFGPLKDTPVTDETEKLSKPKLITSLNDVKLT